MRKLLCVLTVAAAALVGYAPKLHAASVGVDVDITLSSILILYCYNDINVTITGAALAEVLHGSATYSDGNGFAKGGVTATANGASTALEADLGITSDTTNTAFSGNLASVDLDLLNICAVRAIASSATGVTVGAVLNNGTLSGTSSNITIVSVGVTPATIGTGSLGLGTLNPIKATLELNLSTADLAETYTGASSTFTVTALAP